MQLHPPYYVWREFYGPGIDHEQRTMGKVERPAPSAFIRSDTRVPRHLTHCAWGLVFALSLTLIGPLWTGSLLAVASVGAVVLDVVRLRNERVNALFFRVFRSTVSHRELQGPASSTWYLLGSAIVIAVFDPRIAVVGILVLAIADPAASLLGRRWGKRPMGGGTVVGSLTFFVAAFAVTALHFDVLRAGAVALAGTLTEAYVTGVDDNLTVPLTTATALWILSL